MKIRKIARTACLGTLGPEEDEANLLGIHPSLLDLNSNNLAYIVASSTSSPFCSPSHQRHAITIFLIRRTSPDHPCALFSTEERKVTDIKREEQKRSVDSYQISIGRSRLRMGNLIIREGKILRAVLSTSFASENLDDKIRRREEKEKRKERSGRERTTLEHKPRWRGGAVVTMVNDTLLLAAVGNRGRKRRRRYRGRRLEAYPRTKM